MIEVHNIKKSFGDQMILKGITTSFEAGKTSLVIGQSGSVKTVFIKSLLGVHDIDSGHISFDNRIYKDLNKDEKRDIRTEIGMVFQGGALFDSMTVEENVGFPLKMFTNKTAKEIGDILFVSSRTVEKHKSHIIRKANLESKHNSLVLFAKELEAFLSDSK